MWVSLYECPYMSIKSIEELRLSDWACCHNNSWDCVYDNMLVEQEGLL
jgi:hypothetical protein